MNCFLIEQTIVKGKERKAANMDGGAKKKREVAFSSVYGSNLSTVTSCISHL